MSDEALFPNLVAAIRLRLTMAEKARGPWRVQAEPSPVSPDDGFEINVWCVLGEIVHGYSFAVGAAALERDQDPEWVTEVSALAAGKMRRLLATMN